VPDNPTELVVLDPDSALTPAELAAVHAAADDAPPFTDEQRDRLRNIFGPAVRRIHSGDSA
jgi:hypothetical protein